MTTQGTVMPDQPPRRYHHPDGGYVTDSRDIPPPPVLPGPYDEDRGQSSPPVRLLAVIAIGCLLVALLTLAAYWLLADNGDTGGYESADDVVAMLEDEGLSVSSVRETRSMSGARDELDASVEGRETGVLLFPDRESRDSWLRLSRDFGGIAVTRGDELWALSLPSMLGDGSDASLRHANEVATALNGEVN